MAVMEANEDRPVDIRTGSLHIRLAETIEEVEAAQALRYRVFYEDMAAKATPEMAAIERDFDAFDEYCDHLLVFDSRRGDGPECVVGTYRLMDRAAAQLCGRFYTSDEYDISNFLAASGEILEVGRSCIEEAFRTGATMQLLWRGLTAYALAQNVTLMFGCASLPSVDPERLAVPLSYLYHHHLAPPDLRARALAARYVPMDILSSQDISEHRALDVLPPLIKGYLRIGGFVGEGAVIDHDFGTTDVCVVVKTDLMTGRYYRHYKRKHAANIKAAT